MKVKHTVHIMRKALRNVYRTVFFWRRFSPRNRMIFNIGIISLGAIGIPLFFGVLKNIQSAQAAWWNDDWQYRRSVEISSHTSEENNVYITVSIDTSDTNKFQGDCGDLRFTKQNGELMP